MDRIDEYPGIDQAQRLEQQGITVVDKVFTESIIYDLMVPHSLVRQFESVLGEISSGRATLISEF